MNVTIVGVFDVLARHIDPNFQSTRTWCDYFLGEELIVNNVNADLTLQMGEYHIYTDKKLTIPDIGTGIEGISKINQSVRINAFPNPGCELLIFNKMNKI